MALKQSYPLEMCPLHPPVVMSSNFPAQPLVYKILCATDVLHIFVQSFTKAPSKTHRKSPTYSPWQKHQVNLSDVPSLLLPVLSRTDWPSENRRASNLTFISLRWVEHALILKIMAFNVGFEGFPTIMTQWYFIVHLTFTISGASFLWKLPKFQIWTSVSFRNFQMTSSHPHQDQAFSGWSAHGADLLLPSLLFIHCFYYRYKAELMIIIILFCL